MKNRILFVILICIGLLLGISLMKQVEYNDKLSHTKKATMITEYGQCTIKSCVVKEVFLNVDKQAFDSTINEQELLAKSVRERIMVTGER